jgi:hypothetical protein
MELFSEIQKRFGDKPNTDTNTDIKSNCILYKILASINEGEEFRILNIKTNTTSEVTILDLIYNIDVLHGLHPTQACYIGTEYARHLKKANFSAEHPSEQKTRSKSYAVRRYGAYELCYQDHKGNVGFSNPTTEEIFLMDPRDMVISEELIKKFDAAQAFYIGLFAGLKLIRSHSKKNGATMHVLNHLKLVEK